MGIATLWIVFFHAGFDVNIPVLHFIKQVGYGGVDIFMFLSGIGIWFTYEKNVDIVAFLKRRLWRILPCYLPIFMIWYFVKMLKDCPSVIEAGKDFLGNVFMLGWWFGGNNQFNWFVQAIFVFYLLSPIAYAMIKSFRNIKQDMIFVIVFLCVGIIFTGNVSLMAVSRFPIFLLGIIIAKHDFFVESHNFKWVLGISVFVGIIGLYIAIERYSSYLWSYGLWWYPFLVITPGLCMGLGNTLNWIAGYGVFKPVNELLKISGECSLEIMLVQIALFNLCSLEKENLAGWILLIVLSVLVGVLYKKMEFYLKNLMIKENLKRI